MSSSRHAADADTDPNVLPEASGAALVVDAFGMTERGPRPRNEDQFFIADLDKVVKVRSSSLASRRIDDMSDHRGHLFIVADGVGGHEGGDEASSLAVETVIQYVLHTLPWFITIRARPDCNPLAELKKAVERSHAAVIAAAQSSGQSESRMATTLTLACVHWPRLYVVHVGDSRCYLHRKGKLKLLSTDHTAAHGLLEKGVPADQVAPALRHVLTSAIGGQGEINVEIRERILRSGDTLLLCTDGLTEVVPEEALNDALTSASGAEQACTELVGAALDANTGDNVTCVVARLQAKAPSAVS